MFEQRKGSAACKRLFSYGNQNIKRLAILASSCLLLFLILRQFPLTSERASGLFASIDKCKSFPLGDLNCFSVTRNSSEAISNEKQEDVGKERKDVSVDVTKHEDVGEKRKDVSVDVAKYDSCHGKYIYMHNLPIQFNDYFIKNCKDMCCPFTFMCEYFSNLGLGSEIRNKKVLTKTGWFDTNQFALELIFHNRMKNYKCLTHNSSLASAIYVPFYAGLDIGRYLWNFNTSIRDTNTFQLIKWLRQQPEWKYMFGKDHFLVLGRISWDFVRHDDVDSAWGNKLMILPESKNMTFLSIESTAFTRNDFAIPYPTFFHPSRDKEVFDWQNRMRRLERKNLFCFAGAPRPESKDSVRGEIIEQCQASRANCKLLDCDWRPNSDCYNPAKIMKLFESSNFCLQPPGDSYTRKSTFDSIVAGCIPVFFHPGSAYIQYIWHLPKNYSKYSVYIPEYLVREKNVSIEKVLLGISEKEVSRMREEVVRLIPKVIYSNPASRLETVEDAFDKAVKGVVERVEKRRRESREGKDSSMDFPEGASWKYYLTGTTGKHEWDRFFYPAAAAETSSSMS
ncbi:Exostosin, GT47 domain [Dillenia turbinata]|uniref:Exostosin, GT47 domain n=1 Tax=Dillenia turbinata TaxID=194707 RepID=A0AAN8VFD7_9MAGN